MSRAMRLLLGCAIAACGWSARSAAGELKLRATGSLAPCVQGVASAFAQQHGPVSVSVGPLADRVDEQVLIGADVEITRLIESGLAMEGSDVDIARVPWVLLGPEADSVGLEELLRSGVELSVFEDPASHEVLRALGDRPRGRITLTTDLEALRGARHAIVPLSLVEAPSADGG
jgi:hypothetical protein